jgi:hypothetical protein
MEKTLITTNQIKDMAQVVFLKANISRDYFMRGLKPKYLMQINNQNEIINFRIHTKRPKYYELDFVEELYEHFFDRETNTNKKVWRIPDRYLPTIQGLANVNAFKSKYVHLTNLPELLLISFDPAIISLLEQEKLTFEDYLNEHPLRNVRSEREEKRLLSEAKARFTNLVSFRGKIYKFLKELNKRNGIEFDDYINSWAKRLSMEIVLNSTRQEQENFLKPSFSA